MPTNSNTGPFVIRLSAENYAEFARELTKNRNYQKPVGDVLTIVNDKLSNLGAEVYTSCGGAAQPFNASTDKVIPQPDRGRKLNVSLPKYICEDANGNVDLGYLKGYVRDLKQMPEEEAAWALLGMYFLSRCR